MRPKKQKPSFAKIDGFWLLFIVVRDIPAAYREAVILKKVHGSTFGRRHEKQSSTNYI
jgi:hypothetical protein